MDAQDGGVMDAQVTTGNVNLVEVKLEIDESENELPEENEKPNTRCCKWCPRPFQLFWVLPALYGYIASHGNRRCHMDKRPSNLGLATEVKRLIDDERRSKDRSNHGSETNTDLVRTNNIQKLAGK